MISAGGGLIILLFAILMSGIGCSPKIKEDEKIVLDSKELRAKSIAACTHLKKNELWPDPKEIKEYCEEQWRGYKDIEIDEPKKNIKK